MLTRYVFKDLLRNPRRTLSTVIGVLLGIALSCSILFFVDGLSASMSQRAVAPLAVDMQYVITELGSEGSLQFSYTTTQSTANTVARVSLTFKNLGETPMNEVVVRSVPHSKLTYIPGSAMIGDQLITDDTENPFARGLAKEGWNLGTVAPGELVQLGYEVETPLNTELSQNDFATTFSTREIRTPVSANQSETLSLAEVERQVKALPSVHSAERLYLADLLPGSLVASEPTISSVKVFGFNESYLAQNTTIHITEGSWSRDQAILSVEAANEFGVKVGDTVTVNLPDGTHIEKMISGVADLTDARALFESRHGANLEVFLYVPTSIIVDTDSFTNEILPAFERAATTRGSYIKNPPLQEIDIVLEREQLNAEPAVALIETKQIASQVSNLAKGHGYVLDHITNTLEVARGDAAVAKQMFIFLGLPGVLLAAFLAAYAGVVLSGSQRREQATLRIRGANRSHLLRMLIVRVSAITGSGAMLGVTIGFLTAILVIGLSTILRSTATSLLVSALIGTSSGLLATGVALYITGRRSIDDEINADRARYVSLAPKWRRYWLDATALITVAFVTVGVIHYSGFAGTPGSVYNGQSVTIALWLLALPIVVWVAGSLLGGRLVAHLLTRYKKQPQTFTHPFTLLYTLSISRRAWAIAEAAIIIGLIVALSTSLSIFTYSYKAAKVADARYVTGTDIKISPSPASERFYTSNDASRFVSDEVAVVSPVIYSIHNVVLRSDRTSDVANLAAVDTHSYAKIAPLSDEHFQNRTAKAMLSELGSQPDTILLSSDMASFLQVTVGQNISVLLDRGATEQVNVEATVIGLFEKLPGFPDGADALMDISSHEQHAPNVPVTFFLGQALDVSDNTLNAEVQALRGNLAVDDALVVESRLETLAKDQSSLAALNIDGLLKINAVYSLAMGTVVVAIFVFGLLLSRRREYVTLKAQGLSAPIVRSLIGAEALTAAVLGSVVGIPVGFIMAYYFINVLRPLFILNPPYIVPATSVAIIVGLILTTAIVTSILASVLISKLSATELLRDE